MGIVLIRSIILYLAIILALRLMGKRQMGELQPTEFVITLLIAEVAAVSMQSNEIPMAYGLISIAVLVSLEVILSTVSLKFPALNELISGRPSIVVENGKIRQREMERQRFTVSDLCEELRLQKVNRLSDISYAILETNGRLSVFLRPQASPATRGETGVVKPDSGVIRLAVSDGKVNERVLSVLSMTHEQLEELLRERGQTVESTYYCSLDGKGNLIELIPKEGRS